jgi:hypothetical protein
MNGHLRRCRCASAAHVPTTYAASPSERNGLLPAPEYGAVRFPLRCSRRLATYLQEEKCRESPKGASDAFLNRLRFIQCMGTFLRDS